MSLLRWLSIFEAAADNLFAEKAGSKAMLRRKKADAK